MRAAGNINLKRYRLIAGISGMYRVWDMLGAGRSAVPIGSLKEVGCCGIYICGACEMDAAPHPGGICVRFYSEFEKYTAAGLHGWCICPIENL